MDYSTVLTIVVNAATAIIALIALIQSIRTSSEQEKIKQALKTGSSEIIYQLISVYENVKNCTDWLRSQVDTRQLTANSIKDIDSKLVFDLYWDNYQEIKKIRSSVNYQYYLKVINQIPNKETQQKLTTFENQVWSKLLRLINDIRLWMTAEAKAIDKSAKGPTLGFCEFSKEEGMEDFTLGFLEEINGTLKQLHQNEPQLTIFLSKTNYIVRTLPY